jgi:hypothetical protein
LPFYIRKTTFLGSFLLIFTHFLREIKDNFGADYHKVFCYCGAYILEPHFLISLPFPFFGHDYLCLYCGEFVDMDEISQSNSPATLQTEYEYSKPSFRSASISTIELYINKEDLHSLQF